MLLLRWGGNYWNAVPDQKMAFYRGYLEGPKTLPRLTGDNCPSSRMAKGPYLRGMAHLGFRRGFPEATKVLLLNCG